MGRKKKARLGDVVDYGPGFAVVVGYRQDTRGRGEYRLVRVNRAVAGQTYGHTFWMKSYLIAPTGSRYARAVQTVRLNDLLGKSRERGCSCQCCVHTAIARSQVKGDGTFAWEADLDSEGGGATIDLDPEQEVANDPLH